MALNKDCIGRTYAENSPFEVKADAAQAYADATNAGIAAYSGDDAVAPPMYGVAYSFGALGAPLGDGDLNVDFMRLVHGEQKMEFVQAVKPGDVISSESSIARIDTKDSGELIDVDIVSKNQNGDVVLRATSGLFIRASGKGKKGNGDAPKDPFDDLPQLFSVEQSVDDDQSVRYADASGDHNPIHTDKDVAALAGLPGVILHGLCTMAFVHNALVRKLDGDPSRLQQLSVRFSRPVLMGDVLTIDVRGDEAGPWHIKVTNQDGVAVLKNGEAIVS